MPPRRRVVGEWQELPLWLVDPEWRGMMDVHPARVPARPLDDIIGDLLAAESAQASKPEPNIGAAGLSREREAQLLEKLRQCQP